MKFNCFSEIYRFSGFLVKLIVLVKYNDFMDFSEIDSFSERLIFSGLNVLVKFLIILRHPSKIGQIS